jgi:glycosyltransferase involved in cell wall biosynthesis
VIASGEDLARDLVVQFGVPTRWVEVEPPGIVLPELPVVWPEATRVPVVGTSGDLAPGGGLTTFFDAARRLLREGLDVEFVVDGEGPDEALLRRLAVRLGIADRVTFAEDLDLLPVFWKVLDVYCQVSIVPDSGRTLGTALAHGIPAVVSDVPGLRGWVVHGETGLIVPPDRGRDLADALRVLLADRHQARAIGLRAREWAATHCDPEREADALAAAYRRALIEPTTVRSDAS